MPTEMTNFPRESTMREAVNALNVIAIAQSSNAGDVDSFGAVGQLVRQGLGPKAFPVGTEFNVTMPTYGEQRLKVSAHNHHKNALRPDDPTMTLLMNRAIYGRPIDSINSLYHAPDGLAAGNYYFALLAGYDIAYGGGKSYQFTLTQALPAGGVIMFPWGNNVDAALTKISTYATPASVTAIESNISVAEGTLGTFLGTADGTAPNMNHTHRIRYGSNHYGTSGARRWLNSEAAANAWDVPQTKFSRPSSCANVPGFMGELPQALRDILVPVDHICARNTVFELDGITGGSYTVRDKIFLPSMTEMGFGSNNGIAEGTVMQLFAGASNADRIKYDSLSAAVARYYFMRSEYPSSAYSVRYVLGDGALYDGIAYDGIGQASACVIG